MITMGLILFEIQNEKMYFTSIVKQTQHTRINKILERYYIYKPTFIFLKFIFYFSKVLI